MSKVGNNSGQKIEKLLWLVLLPVGKLVDCRISDEPGTSGLEDAVGQVSQMYVMVAFPTEVGDLRNKAIKS